MLFFKFHNLNVSFNHFKKMYITPKYEFIISGCKFISELKVDLNLEDLVLNGIECCPDPFIYTRYKSPGRIHSRMTQQDMINNL